MTKKTTAVAEIAPTEVTTPSVPITEPFMLIAHAVQNGQLDIETIKELRALQKEMKADEAQEAFVRAMAGFQSACPTIEKNKEVKNNGKVIYKYAPLDTIVSTVRPILAKYNLAYTVTVEQTVEAITATCKITHSQGHSETSSFAVPITGTQMMSAPQKVASALTYAKRYAFCNALGILTGDEDTDATQTNGDKQAKDQRAQIRLALRSLGFDSNKEGTEKTREKLKSLTGLEALEKNFPEILEKLNVIISDRNSDTSNVK